VTTTEANTDEVTTEAETETTGAAEIPTTTAGTTTSDSTTTQATSFPAVQLKQSPSTYEKDNGSFYIKAGNYYGDASIGSTFQFTGSAFPKVTISVPANTKIGSKAGDDGAYALFITKDGSHTITYSSEGADSTLQYSIYTPSISGNDITFKPGKTVESNSFECKVKVSGFFLVEAYASFGSGDGRVVLYPGTGLVLSEEEVDEYFATGKIAKYGSFDFSGLKDLIQVK